MAPTTNRRDGQQHQNSVDAFFTLVEGGIINLLWIVGLIVALKLIFF